MESNHLFKNWVFGFHPLPTSPPPPFIVFRRYSRQNKQKRNLILRDRYRYSYRLENYFHLQIQPYIHNYCNNMADKDQLTAITFPDVDPNMLPEDSKQVFFTVILSFDLIFLYILKPIYIYASIGMFSFFSSYIHNICEKFKAWTVFLNLFSLFRCIPLSNELTIIEGWVAKLVLCSAPARFGSTLG